MNLLTIGTGSSGNCYLLNSEDETLILDAGVPFLDAKKALDFDITRIVGVLVTHCHGDHAKYSHEYEQAGIPVWKPYLDTNPRQGKAFGKFTAWSFDQKHDVPCVGYQITHPDGLRLLYATDTEFIRYTFRGLTAMLIEMNWSEEYVDKTEAKYRHVLTGHLSKQTCLDCVKANMNQNLSHVILCHLSEGNSHQAEFKRAVREIVPVWVTVDLAEAGATVDLNEIPF
jgi:phosphoribosyl 1,2-cyclic phosphodiesterase